jgi:hypothetical protein
MLGSAVNVSSTKPSKLNDTSPACNLVSVIVPKLPPEGTVFNITDGFKEY